MHLLKMSSLCSHFSQ